MLAMDAKKIHVSKKERIRNNENAYRLEQILVERLKETIIAHDEPSVVL